ncbi:MAG: hypothetical protein AAGK00_20640 [Pseudomonadota bacterium]
MPAFAFARDVARGLADLAAAVFADLAAADLAAAVFAAFAATVRGGLAAAVLAVDVLAVLARPAADFARVVVVRIGFLAMIFPLKSS